MRIIANLERGECMKEELKKIALELRAWAEKYDKNYVDMACINGNLQASLDTTDEDYNKCDLFIMRHEERQDER